MNMNQHRKLAESLANEAAKIRAELLEGDQAGVHSPAEADAIVWTGQVRIFGQSVWHEFRTPGSWAGFTYYRLPAIGEGLKSREPVLEDLHLLPEDEGHQRDYPLTD